MYSTSEPKEVHSFQIMSQGTVTAKGISKRIREKDAVEKRNRSNKPTIVVAAGGQFITHITVTISLHTGPNL